MKEQEFDEIADKYFPKYYVYLNTMGLSRATLLTHIVLYFWENKIENEDIEKIRLFYIKFCNAETYFEK